MADEPEDYDDDDDDDDDGPEIAVSLSTLDEIAPKVAMDAHGNFVVSWTQILPGGDSNVVAQRFASGGIFEENGCWF